jgi:hypothetical protein
VGVGLRTDAFAEMEIGDHPHHGPLQPFQLKRDWFASN